MKIDLICSISHFIGLLKVPIINLVPGHRLKHISQFYRVVALFLGYNLYAVAKLVGCIPEISLRGAYDFTLP